MLLVELYRQANIANPEQTISMATVVLMIYLLGAGAMLGYVSYTVHNLPSRSPLTQLRMIIFWPLAVIFAAWVVVKRRAQ